MTAEANAPRTRSAVLLWATLALAAVGPALVAWDRWLRLRVSSRHLSAFSDRFRFLDNFNLPDYAVVIAAAFLLLLVLGAFRASETVLTWRRHCAFALRPRRPTSRGTQRSRSTVVAVLGAGAAALMLLRVAVTGHQPGVELFLALCAFAAGMILREVSVAALARVWRRSRGALLSIFAAHAAVILALACHYSFHRFELLSLGLADRLPGQPRSRATERPARSPFWFWPSSACTRGASTPGGTRSSGTSTATSSWRRRS